MNMAFLFSDNHGDFADFQLCYFLVINMQSQKRLVFIYVSIE